jgi:catechol 2,3-dioxygenase-like lactoylglutathione lyase family enzyme
MRHSLAHVALLVRDYDEAIAFYTGVLGFRLVEDTPREPGKRWVVVAPRNSSGTAGTSLLLARAATPEQARFVGNQSGGRVFLFLHTDDFAGDHARLQAAGVRFVREPSREAYGTVAVFEDPYGNRWDLIEPLRAAAPAPGLPLRGGCLCGAVRYAARALPRASTLCHCRSCRLAAGAPSVGWVAFDAGDIVFEGERTTFASSPGIARTFCPHCGTALTWQRDDEPGSMDVQTATLDDPSAFPPTKEIWLEDRIAWEALNPDAVHYARSSVGAAPMPG